MNEFFDTSVLISAFWGGHPHHRDSLRLFASANKKRSSCGIHSLAEVFAGLTALPVKPAIPPEQALLFIEEMRLRLNVIALTERDYFDTIHKAGGQGLTSGRIYDALLLRCAAKSGARAIYTWNLKHFRSIAPELAERIRTPAS
ncbi:MAG: type II toxin-antitoxin system VapC family toxin [Bryobacteraceae bacterium]